MLSVRRVLLDDLLESIQPFSEGLEESFCVRSSLVHVRQNLLRVRIVQRERQAELTRIEAI